MKELFVPYWRNKQGKYIAVDDMTEEHVRNVLKLLCRKQFMTASRHWIDKKNRLNALTNNIESNFKEKEIQSLDELSEFDLF